MGTWTLDVDTDPNAPPDGCGATAGLLWCALRCDGRPCHPSIEGTADEWLAIADAIPSRLRQAFDRVAFDPIPLSDGAGQLWSPRNSTGARDHVTLSEAELADLVRSIREQLAPAAPVHPMADGAAAVAATGAVQPADLEVAEALAARMTAATGVRHAVRRPLVSRPPGGSFLGAIREARAELAARGVKIDAAAMLAEADRPADRPAVSDAFAGRPGGFDPDDSDRAGDDEPPCPDCKEPAILGHTADCGIAAELLAAQDDDAQDDHAADAIVRVLHRGFLPALRDAIDRALAGGAG